LLRWLRLLNSANKVNRLNRQYRKCSHNLNLPLQHHKFLLGLELRLSNHPQGLRAQLPKGLPQQVLLKDSHQPVDHLTLPE
jgi:hypothetical protein